ncbi:hypothetical protein ACOMHN_043287 [Nucella lapillus]
MSSNDAKTYLSKRNVPGLFECLMTGLMFHRPSDHVQYLIDCLEKVKVKGQEELRWNMFIEMQRSKTPLPPITPGSASGRRPISRERSMTPKEERHPHPQDRVSRTPTPLPPIGDKGIPDVPIIFLMGGPGSCKSMHAELLVQRFAGWVRVGVGDLLRQEVTLRGHTEAKWKKVSDLMAKGEMAPQDVIDDVLLAKLKASHNAEGFIIQGFPCDMQQAGQYEKLVGRVDVVFLVDCEEDTLTRQLQERGGQKHSKKSESSASNAAKRIQDFREKTLPVLKYYDDMEKLFILDGEKEMKQIAEDLIMLFETVVCNKGKGSPVEKVKDRISRTTTPLPPIGDKGVPDVPIVLLTGGPGYENSAQLEALAVKYPQWTTMEVDETSTNTEDFAETVLQKMRASHNAKGFIVHGFPGDTERCTHFEKLLGRVDAVFLVDCEEQTLTKKLQGRIKQADVVERCLATYREKSLPALKRYEDVDKLFLVDGEKELKQVTEDLLMLFEEMRTGKGKGSAGKSRKEPKARTMSPPCPAKDKDIPDVPIVFLAGAPGSGKSTQAEMLAQRYPGWVRVPVGELLRGEVADKGTAEAKWNMVNDLMSKGEMAPLDVVDTILLEKLKASHNAEGFIIQGFPCDMDQANDYEKLVGRVDAVLLVDCEEETLSRQLLETGGRSRRPDINVNTVAKLIHSFRDRALPTLKHYEDRNKLFVIDGEQEASQISADLLKAFESVVGTKGRVSPLPVPPKGPPPQRVRSPRSGKTTPQKSGTPEPAREGEETDVLPAHLLPPEVTVKDEGRKPGMPTAPIIFVAGGPGSGKGTQCKRLVSRYTDAVHLSMGDILRTHISEQGSADEKWGMVTELLKQGDLAPEELTVDLLTKALQEKPDAHFYLVEGFPRNLEQLEDFNKQIGGQSFALLLDCEEQILHYRLTVRGKESERIDDNLTAIGKKLTFFKNNTLPILKTMEDSGKLVVVNGDRDDEEITYDLCKVVDFAIYGKLPEQQAATESKEPGKEEAAVEEMMVLSSATTTGDHIGNPAYSAELDATTDVEKQASTAGEEKQ